MWLRIKEQNLMTFTWHFPVKLTSFKRTSVFKFLNSSLSTQVCSWQKIPRRFISTHICFSKKTIIVMSFGVN